MRESVGGRPSNRVLGRAAILALAASAVAWASAAGSPVPSRSAWPQIRLPDSVQVFDAGQDVMLNGMPMQLRGFVSPEPMSRLLPALQRSLGEPLGINHLGDKVVLGRAEGTRFLTIQVERAGTGSRGAIAVADLQAAQGARDDSEQERRRWAEHLPSGSAVYSDMKSRDGPRQSRQLVYSNRQGEAFNRDRLQAMLEREGLRLEHERIVDGEAAPRSGSAVSGRVLFFGGMGKNGMATINREADGRVFVVLNLVSVLGNDP